MKKVTLCEATQACVEKGIKVNVILDADIEELPLKVLKKLEDIGADFLIQEEEPVALPVPVAAPCPDENPAAEKPSRASLNLYVRKIAEMKEKGYKTTEMAEALDISSKQLSAWMYNHKKEVDEAVQELKDIRELAKIF